MQLRVKDCLLVRLPVEAEPLVGSLPLQPPEAVHEVALAEVQLNVALVPFATVLGLAESVMLGTDRLTDTVADCEALPPVPVQVKLYVVFAVSAPVDCDPLTGMVPLQPPLAEQEVALLADQVSVELLPEVIALGPALNMTVGAPCDAVTVAAWVAPPPGPMQVSA